MKKSLWVLAAALSLSACVSPEPPANQNAPKAEAAPAVDTSAPAEAGQYTVALEQAHKETGKLLIRVNFGQGTPAGRVREVSESLIAERRDKFQDITIMAYIGAQPEYEAPYAVTRLRNGAVTHSQGGLPGATKIPTH